MTVLLGACSLFVLLYAGILVRFGLGLRKELSRTSQAPQSLPFFTIVIPARNEQDTIRECLSSIFQNTYAGTRFEVVLVDDQSEDHTVRVAEEFQKKHPEIGDRLRIVRLVEDPESAVAGKKRAIANGIGVAKGDWILTTDADCTAPVTWLQSMAAACEDGTVTVSGGVQYPDDQRLLNRMMVLELFGLVAIGAGGIGSGNPNMANGANLAYRKAVFQEVGGFKGIDHVSSGDDELLLQKIANQYPKGIKFCSNPDALVTTQPPRSLREFIHQRKRWSSKATVYTDTGLRFTVALIYFFFVSLAISFVSILVFPQLWMVLAAIVVLKLISEFFLLKPILARFNQLRLLIYLPLAQFVQPFYVAIVGMLSLFGGFEWKGRALAH